MLSLRYLSEILAVKRVVAIVSKEKKMIPQIIISFVKISVALILRGVVEVGLAFFPFAFPIVKTKSLLRT